MALHCHGIDTEGRWLDFTASSPAGSLTGRAVYAPANSYSDRADWFDSLPIPSKPLAFMAGDFNVETTTDRRDAASLNAVLADLGLVDLLHLEHKTHQFTFFSRNNNRHTAIDKIFCTPEVTELSVSTKIITCSGISDHSAMLWEVSLGSRPKPNPIPLTPSRWTFNPSLLLDSRLDSALDQATAKWVNYAAEPIDCWHAVKTAWHQVALQMHDNGRLTQYRALRHVLSKVESSSATNSDCLTKLREVFKGLQDIHHQQCIMKSQVNWDTKGEMPTPYFTRIIKQRQEQRNIESIVDTEGQRHTDSSSISDVFTSFFKDLYEQDPSTPESLEEFSYKSEDSWDSVLQPISVEEVKEAIARTNSLKSPGPDGLGYSLYKKKKT